MRVKLAGLRTYLKPLVPGGELADLPDVIAVSSGVEPPPWAALAVEVIEGRADAVALLTVPEIARLVAQQVPGVEVVSVVIATGAAAGNLRAFVRSVEGEIGSPCGMLVEPAA